MPYALNAIDAVTALVIVQLTIVEKENEITAIPTLLELLKLQGSLITIDAINIAQSIMNTI